MVSELKRNRTVIKTNLKTTVKVYMRKIAQSFVEI